MKPLNNERFATFAEELLRWGRIHNLTAYDTLEKIQENIEDSIFPLSFIAEFKTALDVGSGGGFPAICLAIERADSHFVLLEPNHKKATFLQVVSARLGLENIEVCRVKLEDFCVADSRFLAGRDFLDSGASQDSRRPKDSGAFLDSRDSQDSGRDSPKDSPKNEARFDLITSRALFPAQKLISLSARFLKESGHFLFYKGEGEIAAKSAHRRGKRVYFYKAKSEV